jgi:hypothetical protein
MEQLQAGRATAALLAGVEESPRSIWHGAG